MSPSEEEIVDEKLSSDVEEALEDDAAQEAAVAAEERKADSAEQAAESDDDSSSDSSSSDSDVAPPAAPVAAPVPAAAAAHVPRFSAEHGGDDPSSSDSSDNDSSDDECMGLARAVTPAERAERRQLHALIERIKSCVNTRGYAPELVASATKMLALRDARNVRMRAESSARMDAEAAAKRAAAAAVGSALAAVMPDPSESDAETHASEATHGLGGRRGLRFESNHPHDTQYIMHPGQMVRDLSGERHFVRTRRLEAQMAVDVLADGELDWASVTLDHVFSTQQAALHAKMPNEMLRNVRREPSWMPYATCRSWVIDTQNFVHEVVLSRALVVWRNDTRVDNTKKSVLRTAIGPNMNNLTAKSGKGPLDVPAYYAPWALFFGKRRDAERRRTTLMVARAEPKIKRARVERVKGARKPRAARAAPAAAAASNSAAESCESDADADIDMDADHESDAEPAAPAAKSRKRGVEIPAAAAADAPVATLAITSTPSIRREDACHHMMALALKRLLAGELDARFRTQEDGKAPSVLFGEWCDRLHDIFVASINSRDEVSSMEDYCTQRVTSQTERDPSMSMGAHVSIATIRLYACVSPMGRAILAERMQRYRREEAAPVVSLAFVRD